MKTQDIYNAYEKACKKAKISPWTNEHGWLEKDMTSQQRVIYNKVKK